jgi:opacity protein-like surface antigen
MTGNFPLSETKQNLRRSLMKKIMLASVCILALASPAAFAQTAQPTGGASSQGNVGPGASQGAMKDGTGTTIQGTTGTSSKPSPGGDASTSGADTAAGVKNTGPATTSGAVKDGVNKQ